MLMRRVRGRVSYSVGLCELGVEKGFCEASEDGRTGMMMGVWMLPGTGGD